MRYVNPKGGPRASDAYVPGIAVGDFVFVPGVEVKVHNMKSDVSAYVGADEAT